MQHTLNNLLGGFSGAITADIIEKDTGKYIAAFEMVNGYKNKLRIMYVTPEDEENFTNAAKEEGLSTSEYINNLVRCSLENPVAV